MLSSCRRSQTANQVKAVRRSAVSRCTICAIRRCGVPPSLFTDARYLLAGSFRRISAFTSLAWSSFLGLLGGRSKTLYLPTAAVGQPGGSRQEANTPLTDNALRESDPRIYVEIIDGRRDLGTPFVLYNRGGGNAYDVQIHPIGLKEGTATFPSVRKISIDARTERLPDVDTRTVLQKHDFVNLLMFEWKSREGQTIAALPVSAIVIYRDSKRNWFETLFEIVFYPSADDAPSEWGGRPKMIEVSKCECRRLSASESRHLRGNAWA
jgi:hypothetical protein